MTKDGYIQRAKFLLQKTKNCLNNNYIRKQIFINTSRYNQIFKDINLNFFIAFFFFCTSFSFAQQTVIKRASLSTAPQTFQVGDVMVQQSVGHMGLIRTSKYNDNTVISGFLLPQTFAQDSDQITPQPSIEWQLYPNPFSTHINIDFSAAVSGDMKLLLFDVAGQLVMKKTLEAKQQQRIPMGHLAHGEYIIHITVMEKSFSAQLLNYSKK